MTRSYRAAEPKPRRQRGFTLIELMITVAIIGVLAAIAYPSYQSYLRKSRRAEAQGQLLTVAQLEQQYLLDARAYTATLGAGGLNLTPPPSVTAYYTITISAPAAAPPSFTATATPVAGTSQEVDGPLSINSAGTKTPSGLW